jgi:hypothetical protein
MPRNLLAMLSMALLIFRWPGMDPIAVALLATRLTTRDLPLAV